VSKSLLEAFQGSLLKSHGNQHWAGAASKRYDEVTRSDRQGKDVSEYYILP